ncbi:MAG: cyclic-di-AMP receptor [Chloroflexota bacterium]
MPNPVNLLFVIIVNGLQAEKLMKALREQAFYFTVIDSSGGFLQEPTMCLLIGLSKDRRDELVALVKEHCHPFRQYIPTQMNVPADFTQVPMIEALMGGAVMFSMNVERFIQI